LNIVPVQQGFDTIAKLKVIGDMQKFHVI
jgi:hypothetical protein